MNLKKLFVMLTTLLLVISMLASCALRLPITDGTTGGDNEPDETTASTTVTTTDDGKEQKPPKEQVETLTLFQNGVSGYRIVYSLGRTEWEENAAKDLQTAIKRLTGVTLTIINDLEFEDEPKTMRQEKEILIGDTSRSDEYNVTPATDINLGYNIFVSYERIVILGNSHVGMYQAIRQFILDQFGYDLENYNKDVNQLPVTDGTSKATVAIHHSYYKKATVRSDYFEGMNIMLGDIVIKHNGTSLQHRVAFQVKDAIATATENKVHLTVTNQKPADGTPIITFASKPSLAKGTWEIIATDDKTITVYANGYYGFYDAATYFRDALKTDGFYSVTKAQTGNFVSHASGQQEATKYIYNQQGDVRVMFLNVLFGSPNPDLRNPLQGYLIEEWQPDVLGCQEFNYTKRGGQANLAGDGGLVEILRDLGYAESIDPRVRNAYGPGELIPGTEDWAYLTNPKYQQGDKHHGYGGGTTVTVNGQTYSTFYNNTPVFYNTATTEWIASEYYWYKSQWDKITGTQHDNSAMDCGSKAATWAVLKDKETQEQYIVISTHMCTRSNYIRGLQGQEIVALINKLVTTYQCPVFFGGDMNGNIGDANYDLFIESGFLSLQDSLIGGKHVASEYTSNLRTNQSAYPVFDTEMRIMTPAPGSTIGTVAQTTNANSIDQIFLIDKRVLAGAVKEVDVKVFGIIADDVARSSSDHTPIFTDFSFK